MSAPSFSATLRWWEYLAPTRMVHGVVGRTTWCSAATVANPKVPAPSTATVSPGVIEPPQGGVHGAGGGLDRTASSSVNESGTV